MTRNHGPWKHPAPDETTVRTGRFLSSLLAIGLLAFVAIFVAHIAVSAIEIVTHYQVNFETLEEMQ